MKNPVIYRVINQSNNIVQQFRRAEDVAYAVIQNPQTYLIIKSQAQNHQLIAKIPQDQTHKELTLWLNGVILNTY